LELYYERPYDFEFEAKIVEVADNYVVLDRTLFYPVGGGQPSDTGYISDVRVERVEKRDKILHFLEEKPPFHVGNIINGRIDRERRLKIMRVHTALHLLTNICNEMLGNVEHVGSGMSDKKGHIDIYYAPRVKPDLKQKITTAINNIIHEGVGVRTWFDGQTRYVQIGDYDALMCGGTHVRNVNEIGEIRVKRKNVGKGKDRLEVTISD